MTNLTRFETDDGIELVIDTETGESFVTQSGYAKMAGLSQQAINKRCNTYNQDEFKKAELPTTSGSKTYNLIPGKLARKWLLNDNPELLEAMSDAGWNVYCHLKAGYKVSSTAIAPKPISAIELVQQQIAALTTLAEISVEHERKLIEIQNQIVETEKQLAAQKIEIDDNASELQRFKNGHGTYFSIAGWCAKHGFRRSLEWMKAQGRKATTLCKSKGIKKEKVDDPRWGSVGAYPDTVLSELAWNDEK